MIKIMKLNIFILFFVLGCKTEANKKFTPEKVIEPQEVLEGKFKINGQNLYKDKTGNIYFRVIDRSAINENHEVFADYINYLRFDTVINKEESYVEKELKDVIDCQTFKFREKIGQANYYEDRKHRYFHLEVASGGVLHCYK